VKRSIKAKIAHPKIVSRKAWLTARTKHLINEKKLTKQKDKVNAERRRLPMVKIDKEYMFEGPEGERSLRDLFDNRRELIVYHFMFDPEWQKGCPGCSLLDTTPYGRQEDFEDSPPGWPQKPTYC